MGRATASQDGSPADREKKLLDGYETYDQHVDVVSAFEFLFTQVPNLSATVRHFERFPRIQTSSGVVLTPDFTVLFDDETAIIGEIAKVAKPDGSVDKLCKQILGYDRLEKVPSGPNGFAAPKYLDVLQIVSVRVGNEACQRIVDRMKDPNHFYKPSRSPVIVQYARESELYIFQRIPHIDNGRLYGGERSPNIGGYLDRDLKVGAHRFVKVKAARALINDQADSLYLATHLWAKTWPTLYGVGTSDIIIDPAKTAEALRKQYGIGRIRDVKRALDLLEEAGLAAKTVGDQWVISRKLLGRRGQRETHSIIAHRACAQNTPKSVRGRVGMHDASGRGNHIQGTLF